MGFFQAINFTKILQISCEFVKYILSARQKEGPLISLYAIQEGLLFCKNIIA